jgi:hypothetical protein
MLRASRLGQHPIHCPTQGSASSASRSLLGGDVLRWWDLRRRLLGGGVMEPQDGRLAQGRIAGACPRRSRSSATMAWSSVVWAGKSTSTVRAATAGPIPSPVRIPGRRLPTNCRRRTSPRRPGSTRSPSRATPWLSSSTRQRLGPPSQERRGRIGCYGSVREADQEQGRVPRGGLRNRAPSRRPAWQPAPVAHTVTMPGSTCCPVKHQRRGRPGAAGADGHLPSRPSGIAGAEDAQPWPQGPDHPDPPSASMASPGPCTTRTTSPRTLATGLGLLPSALLSPPPGPTGKLIAALGSRCGSSAAALT